VRLIAWRGEIINRNKKPGFITSKKTSRGITGTLLQIYKKMDRKVIERVIIFRKVRTLPSTP